MSTTITTNPAHLTLCAASAHMAYNAMRGASRMTWLRLQANNLESGYEATTEQLDALVNICDLADCSPSVSVKNLSRRLRMAVRDAAIRNKQQAAQQDADKRQAQMAQANDRAEGKPVRITQTDDGPVICAAQEQDEPTDAELIERMQDAENAAWGGNDDGKQPLPEETERKCRDYLREIDHDNREQEAQRQEQRSEWITAAPECYDGFDTRTVRRIDNLGRIVSISAEHLVWQRMRYQSGMYSTMPVEAQVEAPQAEAPRPVADGTGMSRIDAQVLHAVAQHRKLCFVDMLAVPADARAGAVLESLAGLAQLGYIVEDKPRTALHAVMLHPDYANRLDSRQEVLPEIPSVQPRQSKVAAEGAARKPRADNSAHQVWTLTYKGRKATLRACEGGWQIEGTPEIHKNRASACKAFGQVADARLVRSRPG